MKTRILNPKDDPFDQLSDAQLIAEPYVAELLQCSTSWLAQRRAAGEPPPYAQGMGDLVRYNVGTLRRWIAANNADMALLQAPAVEPIVHDPTAMLTPSELASLVGAPVLKGGRRRSRFPNVQTFFAQAMVGDEWLFALVGESRRPLDIFAAIDLDLEPHSFEWLRFIAYSERLTSAISYEAQKDRAKESFQDLGEMLAAAPPAPPDGRI